MKAFYMILVSIVIVLIAVYDLRILAHEQMPFMKRLAKIFPPLFLLTIVILRIIWLFIR